MPERASTTTKRDRRRGAYRLAARHRAHVIRCWGDNKAPVESGGGDGPKLALSTLTHWKPATYGWYPRSGKESSKLIGIDHDFGGLAGVEAFARDTEADPVLVTPSGREGRYHAYYVDGCTQDKVAGSWSLPEGSGEIAGDERHLFLHGDEADELVRTLDRSLDEYRPLTDAGLARITKKKPEPVTIPHTGSKTRRRRSKGGWRDTPTGSRRATFISLCGSMWRKKGNWGWSLTTRLEWAGKILPQFRDQGDHPFPCSDDKIEEALLHLHASIEAEKATGELERNWKLICSQRGLRSGQVRRYRLYNDPSYRKACRLNHDLARKGYSLNARKAEIEKRTGICKSRSLWSWRLKNPLRNPASLCPMKQRTPPPPYSSPSYIQSVQNQSAQNHSANSAQTSNDRVIRQKYKPGRLYWWHVWRRKRRGEISNQIVGRFLNRKRVRKYQ